MINVVKEKILLKNKNILSLLNIICFMILIAAFSYSYISSNDALISLIKCIYIFCFSLVILHFFNLFFNEDKKKIPIILNIIILINIILMFAAILYAWPIILVCCIIDFIYLLCNISFKNINLNKIIKFNIILFLVTFLSFYNETFKYSGLIEYSVLKYFTIILCIITFIIYIFMNKEKIYSKTFLPVNIILFLTSIISLILSYNNSLFNLYIVLNIILLAIFIISFCKFKFKLLSSLCLILLVVFFVIINKSDDYLYINNSIDSNLIDKYNELIKDNNDYSLKKDYKYVQIVQKIDCNNWKNTLYTIADAGLYYDTSICSTNFDEKKSYINVINSFVHPFNMLEINDDNLGKRKYNYQKINDLISYVDQTYISLYDANVSLEENIKKFHDELISYNIFGGGWLNTKIIHELHDYDSETAAVVMKLLLDKLGVENKIIYGLNNKNVWNIVKINDKYLHLDLYYNDKLSYDDFVSYKYFLIDDKTINSLDLKSDDNDYHKYDKYVYKEFMSLEN